MRTQRGCSVQHFGNSRLDGQRVALITVFRPFRRTRTSSFQITNSSGASVELLSLGASVRSIRVPDRSGRIVDVVLGFDTLREYESSCHSLGATLGRVAGIIGNARFTDDQGRVHVLAANAGAHHLDGGSRRPIAKIWSHALDESSNWVTFSLVSADGDQGYPGEVRLQVKYVWTDSNELVVQHTAQAADRDTPLALATNLYMNLNGEGSSSLLDHVVHMHSDRVLSIDRNGLPTGQGLVRSPDDGKHAGDVRPPARMVDFTSPKKVTRFSAPHVDHTYVIRRSSGATATSLNLHQVARVTSIFSGIDLHVLSSEPCARLELGSQFGRSRGKRGHVFARNSAVLVSPRAYPNAVNQPLFPSILVPANGAVCTRTVYRFSTVFMQSKSQDDDDL